MGVVIAVDPEEAGDALKGDDDLRRTALRVGAAPASLEGIGEGRGRKRKEEPKGQGATRQRQLHGKRLRDADKIKYIYILFYIMYI